MYKGLVVAREALADDDHFSRGCPSCHKGDEKASDKDQAHRGLVKRPSDDPAVCGECHEEIAETYAKALHFTVAGLKNGVMGRFSASEKKRFQEAVFEPSCRKCHASCGDCHVKGPLLDNVTTGLIRGHAFVRKDESKTCAFCHGGRVHPEFTGSYGVIPDVHHKKGMTCMDCHKMEEMHGDGNAYATWKERKIRPSCASCHPPGEEKSDKAREAHAKHQGILTCSACHALSTYRNCRNCHLGKGSESEAGFILGRSPRNKDLVTTLRLIPAVRDTFAAVGIRMENYDALPNYWDTVPHCTCKLTERTGNCQMCHLVKMGFLKKSDLPEGGSKANEGLIYAPRPIKE